jgi:hypothetical protein
VHEVTARYVVAKMSRDGYSPQSPANGSPSASRSAGDPGAGRGFPVSRSRNASAKAVRLRGRSVNGSEDMPGRRASEPLKSPDKPLTPARHVTAAFPKTTALLSFVRPAS